MNLPAMHCDLWAKATSGIQPELARHLPGLALRLQQSELLLAKILTGRTEFRKCTSEDARDLEALLLLRIVQQEQAGEQDAKADSFRLNEVKAWLRILYVAIKWFRSQGYDLATTRLPLSVKPDRSPFSPQRVSLIADVDLWRKALFRGVRSEAHRASDDNAVAMVALSSILCGCLLSTKKVLMFVNSLHYPIVVSRRIAIFDFDLPYRGVPDAQLQRWFIDPLTELIASQVKTPNIAQVQTEKTLYKNITNFLSMNGCGRLSFPTTLGGFIDAASSYWESRTAMIDIQFVRQRFLSHSLTRQTWLRIAQCVDNSQPSTIAPVSTRLVGSDKPDSDIDSDTEELVRDSVAGLDWFNKIKQSLDARNVDLDAVRKDIEVIHGQGLPPAAITYLDWLDSLCRGKSSSGNRLAGSTIVNYFTLITPLMISILGEEDPGRLSLEDLTSAYQWVLTSYEGAASRSVLSKALREFQNYLARGNKELRLKETRELLGDEAVLSPVEARIISFDEYEEAKVLLKSKLRKYDRRKVDASLLLLILAFRTGLRRSEAIKLLLSDFHLDGNPMLLIRPHAERRLKSLNSKRTIPLRYFLSASEMRFASDFIECRREEERAHPYSDFVFAAPAADRTLIAIETLVDWIHESIREVTGDPTLHLHHLRHSFGTWTYLKLRCPDHPYLINKFSHLPATHMQLGKGRRLRCLLLGTGAHPVRGYAFAVARLLGHSGPNISMEHYIHASDLVVWADTVRDFKFNVDKRAVVALSPLSQSQTYECLESDFLKILEAARKNLPGKYRALPAAQAKDKSNKIPPGRPRKNGSPAWIALHKVWEVLHLSEQGAGAAEASIKSGISETKVASIITSARSTQANIGLKPDILHGIVCPTMPRIGGDVAFFNDIERRLSSLFIRDPALYRKGLEIILAHYNRKRGDVVFRNVDEPEDALTFLRFIDAMGYPPKQIRPIIRAKEHGNHSLALWRKALGQPISHPDFIKADFSNHPSYSKWIGFELKDGSGQVHRKVFVVAIYLAVL